jgi:hypothetical protein
MGESEEGREKQAVISEGVGSKVGHEERLVAGCARECGAYSASVLGSPTCLPTFGSRTLFVRPRPLKCVQGVSRIRYMRTFTPGTELVMSTIGKLLVATGVQCIISADCSIT